MRILVDKPLSSPAPDLSAGFLLDDRSDYCSIDVFEDFQPDLNPLIFVLIRDGVVIVLVFAMSFDLNLPKINQNLKNLLKIWKFLNFFTLIILFKS